MIRTLVVEDEAASRSRIVTLAAAFKGVDVIGECADGMTAVADIVALRPDLVLLDVQLPELDGFEVLAALPSECRPAVLFITAYDRFAIRAFDADAIDYVLKPFSAIRFTRALGRAIERLERRSADPSAPSAQSFAERMLEQNAEQDAKKPLKRFVVRAANKVYFVRPDDVDWIDVVDNYLRLHVGGRTHLVRGTMASIASRLDPDQFLRVHRGAIVRVDAIATVEAVGPATYRIVTVDGARIQSSRSYAEPIRALMRA